MRIAGHMATARFVPFWGEGKDSFLKDPPNATLSFLEDQGLADAVVELRHPVLEGDALSYQVTVLEGEIPSNAGLASTSSACRCPRCPSPVHADACGGVLPSVEIDQL